MAYSSYSGPLKNPFNDINNEDDEFGDFTSAVTYPTIGIVKYFNRYIELLICFLFLRF
jgi:hypothetical protein